ncbi:MAG TPA: hypothetical protein VD788_14565 [Candidatus Polarisedimenticolaceae bacterium]|nr:hypothetical protein [Candidatus Polarisedimenticolaceae bacterium]
MYEQHMDGRWRWPAVCGGVLIAVAVGGTAAREQTTPAPGERALDYAFRFAGAVDDAKDRAKAQESAINGYVDAGLLDEAELRAAEIEGWRRGVVLGRLAALRLREGDAERARGLLAAAERSAGEVQDWGRDRILAQVAEVRALLGEDERAREIGEQLIRNDPRTYEGRATVALASALAARGDLAGAQRTIGTLDDSVDLYVAWWRTEGYLDLAERAGVDPSQRAELLDRARLSARAIVGWKQAEMLQRIAAAEQRAGRDQDALESLERAERIVLDLPRTMSLRGPLLADLARSWVATGRREHALELVGTAERDLDYVASIVERPAAIARVATGYVAVGRDGDGVRLLRLALARAQALENPRPRALALSAVCREAGRHGVEFEEDLTPRLDAMLAELTGETVRAGL